MKYKTVMAVMLGFFGVISESLAVITHKFTPSVVIEGSAGKSLEIYAPQLAYEVPYSVLHQTFTPLNIPFEVVSVTGVTVDYRLSAISKSAVCIAGESEEDIELDYTLDGEVWPDIGLDYKGVRNSHVIKITYPVVRQKATRFQCEGKIGVQVETVKL